MATKDLKKQKKTRYLRALFDLDTAARIVENAPDPTSEHHVVRLREASRVLADILIDELTEGWVVS